MATKKQQFFAFRSYASYLRTYRGWFLLIFAIALIASILLALVPIFIGFFVEALARQSINSQEVYWLAGALIFCSVGHDIAWRSFELLYLRFLTPHGYGYEDIVLKRVITQPYPYFVGKFTGKISGYVSTLGREYRAFIEQLCYNYADQIVKLPSIAIILFTVNLHTGVVFVISIILMFVVGRLTVRMAARAERELTDVTSNLDGYVIDIIANFVSVKAFRKEQLETNIVVKKRGKVIAAAKKAFFWNIVFWGSMSLFVRYVIWPATILINTNLFLQGQLSLGQMTTFLSVITIFSDYIWGTVWTISQLNLQLARTEEAYRYLFGERNIVKEGSHTPEPVIRPPEFRQSLELNNLTFAYPDKPDRQVLREIHLTIRKHEKLGIVGRSGSGKTTLIKLLLGYYHVPPAQLVVDGQAVGNASLAGLISYVPQDTALFHRSIAENIAYGGHGTVSREAIEQAARQAHAHEFIADAPLGYDTLVGERGIKLSMGQRQRVAIARAFLDSKPILLLDEATSALDSESEVLVQRALEDLWQSKTVIAIAHRLSTLRNMDRIIVIDEGRLIEEGTHDELLAARGAYWRLWQHQSGGLIVE